MITKDKIYKTECYLSVVETNKDEHIYTLSIKPGGYDYMFLTKENLKELKTYIDKELNK